MKSNRCDMESFRPATRVEMIDALLSVRPIRPANSRTKSSLTSKGRRTLFSQRPRLLIMVQDLWAACSHMRNFTHEAEYPVLLSIHLQSFLFLHSPQT